MESKQIVNSAPTSTPMNSEARPELDMVANKMEKKKSNGIILVALGLCIILAIGGIGFGAWTMMDGNNQKEVLSQQISDLKKQNSELQEKVKLSIGGDTTNETANNPIIKDTLTEDYSANLVFESSSISESEKLYVVTIGIKNGEIIKCEVGNRTISGSMYVTEKVADCSVSGLDGKIFNVIEFGAGQDSSLRRIGFIMADGAVKYTSTYSDMINNNDFGIKGTLKIEGKAVSAIPVQLSDTARGYGGYSSTVFVFDNGEYVLFDESML